MSPRSDAQLKEIRDATRRRILDASLELFGTKGYDTTTITDIVKKAGISKGLIYHYFDSKKDILEQLVADLSSQADRSVGEILHCDPRDLLKVVIELFFREIRHNFDQWALILKLSVQVNHFDFIHDISVSKLKGYIELMTGMFDRLGYENPESEARILAAIFDGIGIQYYIVQEEAFLAEIEKSIYEKYNLT